MIVLLWEVGEKPRKRRDSLEIIAGILKAARNGRHKTQIMQEAGLSSAQLTGYLSFLAQLGLLEPAKRNEKVCYKTAAKGIQFIKSYEEIKRLLRKNAEHGVADLGPPFSFPK